MQTNEKAHEPSGKKAKDEFLSRYYSHMELWVKEGQISEEQCLQIISLYTKTKGKLYNHLPPYQVVTFVSDSFYYDNKEYEKYQSTLIVPYNSQR